jgi:hypothetical protein
MLSTTNRTMSISRLCFCTGFKLFCSCTGFEFVYSCTSFKLVCFYTGFKLVCSPYFHHHHFRFPVYDYYHQFSYGYVSTLLTPPKGRSGD